MFRRVAADKGGELLELELWLPAGHFTPDHVHPRIEERWEVLVGQIAFTIDGRDVLLGPGDPVAASAGVRHGSTNVGRSGAHLQLEFRHAMRWEDVVVTLYALGAWAVAVVDQFEMSPAGRPYYIRELDTVVSLDGRSTNTAQAYLAREPARWRALVNIGRADALTTYPRE